MATEIDDGRLIETIRKFPTLYNRNNGDYRNKQSKINAWISISRIMGLPEDLCEQRWIVLRNRYATELRNKKKNPSDVDAGPTWRHSEAMSFLGEYILPRRTRCSISSPVRTFTPTTIKSEVVESPSSVNHSTGEGRVALELRPASPNNTATIATRLRPIAPRPAVSTVARLVPIPNKSNSSVTNSVQNSSFTYGSRYVEGRDNQEAEDEDILFGKSIGHTLKNIKNKKMKLQIKSEILSILAQHVD